MQDSDNKYLIFPVDDKVYAISFSDVKLIIANEYARKIPDFPDYVKGTIVNEGRTVTVIDLRVRFGCVPKPETGRECIMLCDCEKSLGLLCDSISGFVEVRPEEIQPPPDVNEQVNARFISGTFLHEGQPCYIIRPELVIRPDDEEKFASLTEE